MLYPKKILMPLKFEMEELYDAQYDNGQARNDWNPDTVMTGKVAIQQPQPQSVAQCHLSHFAAMRIIRHLINTICANFIGMGTHCGHLTSMPCHALDQLGIVWHLNKKTPNTYSFYLYIYRIKNQVLQSPFVIMSSYKSQIKLLLQLSIRNISMYDAWIHEGWKRFLCEVLLPERFSAANLRQTDLSS